jgi:hypothetical protein
MTTTKTPRISLSKKVRFEVLKRDSFTCEYCGRKAPNVLLHVDHIKPISKGGTNDILNLVTACEDCNSGKSNRELSDTTVIEQRRKQSEELQKRLEQKEMLIKWQEELTNIEKQTIKRISKFWNNLITPYKLNKTGEKELIKLIHKFGESEVMEAMRIATRQYLEYDGDYLVNETVEKAWNTVSGICRYKKLEKEKPYITKLLYIRGILKNRLNFVDEKQALQLLDKCIQSGIDVEWLERHAKECTTWVDWRKDIEEVINESQSVKKFRRKNKIIHQGESL